MKSLIAEDEGARVRGRRLTLSDVNGNGLRWRPFNGTWINGKSNFLFTKKKLFETFVFDSDGELIYRDTSGGLSILEVETLTAKVLMTNSTFVRDLNFLQISSVERFEFFIYFIETIEC